MISLEAHAQRPPTGARVIVDFWLWDPQDAIAVKAGKTAALSRRIFEKEVALP